MKHRNLFLIYGLIIIVALAFMSPSRPHAAEEAAAPAADPAAPEGTILGPDQAPVAVTVIPRFDVKDLYGRVIAGADLQDWVVLYCFGNEDTAGEGINWLKQLSLKNFDAKGILYVIVADTSKYHKALFPMVKKQAKGEYEKKLQEFTRELEENGYKYDFKLEDRYVMTLDTSAAVFKLFGIGGQRAIPHVFIVDGNGQVRGHFTQYTDAAPELLKQVLAERDAHKQAAAYQLTMKTRKRQMWKRYALFGAIGWLVFK